MYCPAPLESAERLNSLTWEIFGFGEDLELDANRLGLLDAAREIIDKSLIARCNSGCYFSTNEAIDAKLIPGEERCRNYQILGTTTIGVHETTFLNGQKAKIKERSIARKYSG